MTTKENALQRLSSRDIEDQCREIEGLKIGVFHLEAMRILQSGALADRFVREGITGYEDKHGNIWRIGKDKIIRMSKNTTKGNGNE